MKDTEKKDTEKKDRYWIHTRDFRRKVGIQMEQYGVAAFINELTIERNGIQKQSLVAMEELSELQKAISKLARNPKEKTDHLQYECLKTDMAEEIADVIICINQMRMIYDLDANDIQQRIMDKQNRQLHRLKEGFES